MPTDDEESKDVRHKGLWFQDGSIILRAERTLFRVHMSQLSRQSLLFKDMFTLPQPSNSIEQDDEDNTILAAPTGPDDESIQGCPVIPLYDDPNDLAVLLGAIYDGPWFGDNGREDFAYVSALLRLSTKYIVDTLRRKALEHLSEAWPPSLKGWDSREEHARTFELETGRRRAFRYPSPIAIIKLAIETDATALLPSAFYDLSRYSYSQLLEAAEDSPLLVTAACQPHELLSPDSMRKLALGKDACSEAITALIQGMTSPTRPPSRRSNLGLHRPGLSISSTREPRNICTTASACRADLLELAELATQHYIFDKETGYADPLYVAEELGQLGGAESTDGEECRACARILESWATRERVKIWNSIPSWFRLDQ